MGDMVKKAEHVLTVSELKEVVKQMADFIPEIAKMTMNVYKEFIEVGFTEKQAFEFAKEYTIKMITGK